MGRGKRVTAREKRLIERFRSFLVDESRSRHSFAKGRVWDRLQKATGLSRSTLSKIHSEFESASGVIDDSPAKRTRYRTPRPIAINVDDFDRACIRRTLHDLYERKEYPTIDSLLAELKKKGVFSQGRTTLFKVVKSMGFRERNDKAFLYERRDIIECQHKYL